MPTLATHCTLLHSLIPVVGNQNITTSSCDAIYGFIEQLLIDLDVAEYCCLAEDDITCANNGTSTHRAKGIKVYTRKSKSQSISVNLVDDTSPPPPSPSLSFPLSPCSLWLWFSNGNLCQLTLSSWTDPTSIHNEKQQTSRRLPVH